MRRVGRGGLLRRICLGGGWPGDRAGFGRRGGAGAAPLPRGAGAAYGQPAWRDRRAAGRRRSDKWPRQAMAGLVLRFTRGRAAFGQIRRGCREIGGVQASDKCQGRAATGRCGRGSAGFGQIGRRRQATAAVQVSDTCRGRAATGRCGRSSAVLGQIGRAGRQGAGAADQGWAVPGPAVQRGRRPWVGAPGDGEREERAGHRWTGPGVREQYGNIGRKGSELR